MPLFKDKRNGHIIEAFKFGIDYIPDWFMNLVTENKIKLISDDHGVTIKCQNAFNMVCYEIGTMIVKNDIMGIDGYSLSEFDEMYEKIKLMNGKIDEYGNLIIQRIRKGKEFFVHQICPFMSKSIKECIYCGDRCPHFSDIYCIGENQCLDLCHGKTLIFESLDDDRELTKGENDDEE